MLLAAAIGAFQQPPEKPSAPVQAPSARTAAVPLLETHWTLTALGDLKPTRRPEGREPHLVFHAAGSVTGHDGCNALRGGYTSTGDSLTFTNSLGTLMTCPDQDKLDRRFRDALGLTRTWKIAGQALTLFDAKGAALARFEAQLDR
jgi:copper homeostasis protein (lipoprotein)